MMYQFARGRYLHRYEERHAALEASPPRLSPVLQVAYRRLGRTTRARTRTPRHERPAAQEHTTHDLSV